MTQPGLPERLNGVPLGNSSTDAVATDLAVGLPLCVRLVPIRGPVAQLGARVNGIHEVTGSIPVWSTIRFGREAAESNALSEPNGSGRVEGPVAASLMASPSLPSLYR